MTSLAEAYEAEGIAPPKPRRWRPEAALQTQLKRLVREYVAVEHEFAAHDRSENTSGTQHFWEKQRGARKGWPDIEIPLMGGRTFRCELKARGKKPDADQLAILARLNYLKHPSAWADSAVMFVAEARAHGVVFRPGVDRLASAIDAMLAQAGAVRKVAKPAAPRAKRPTAAAKRVGAAFHRP
jgi:hypothetical protein